MKLDNFILEEYNEENNMHVDTVNILNSDPNTKKYLGNLNYTILVTKKRELENLSKLNKSYIVYKNGNRIGFINITYIDDEYNVSYAILPNYRNEHLGLLLLQQFSMKLLDENIVNELVLKIDEKNIGSIKVAEAIGYKKENDNKYHMK